MAFSDCRLPFFVSGPAKWMESMAIPEATALDNSKHAAKLGSVSIPHKHTHKHTHTHTYNLYYIIRTYIYIYNMCNYVYNYVYSYIIKLYNYIYISFCITHHDDLFTSKSLALQAAETSSATPLTHQAHPKVVLLG